MTKVFEERKTKQFVIPLLLFLVSFSILSFNLSEQGPHQDELDFFYAYSVVYFNLIKDGDFFHPCWNGDGECKLLSVAGCNMDDHWVTTHGLVKHVLVGAGIGLHGEKEWESYAPTPPLCKPHTDPIFGVNVPEKSELSAARFFTPILGSLTVVLAFYIGNFLFNRITGLSFALLLLFNSLWFAYSRTIMTETYIYFFMILSFFLLLYSFREKGRIRYPLLISSAVIFGIAFDTKAIVFMFFPLFLLTIFLRNSINEKLSRKTFQIKNYFPKSIAVSSLYTGILIVSIIATLPFYWIGPIDQIIFQKESLDAYNTGMSLHMPWDIESKLHVRFISTVSVTFFPVIDTYYNFFSPDNIPESVDRANNFSSIPLSILFITGIGFLIHSIKNKTVTGSELLIMFWVSSVFILLSTMMESYSPSRFFVMMFFPLILVSSYGYWKFFNTLASKRIQVFSFSLFIIAHAITTLIFWKEIFFKPSIIWLDPLFIKSQVAITHIEVLAIGIAFSIFFVFFGIKRIKISKRNIS